MEVTIKERCIVKPNYKQTIKLNRLLIYLSIYFVFLKQI